MQLIRISPMDKLLPGQDPVEDHSPVSVPQNGHMYFQIAYRGRSARSFDAPLLHIQTESRLPVTIYRVELVPCTLPAYPGADDNYLTKTPGLIPDRLAPYGEDAPLRLLSDYWQTIWVEAYDPLGLPPGTHTIRLRFQDRDGMAWGELTLEAAVEPRMLPDQSFLHSQWLHLDCLCHAHRCRPFSSRFWALAERYLQCQIDHGINVAWVPIFTPPLDTSIGGERKTIQLIGVENQAGRYRFDFSKLERWLNLCKKLGFSHFEFSHLFTQWGAQAAPKIMVMENGTARKAFGWHTPACAAPYAELLSQFLPLLRTFLVEQNVYGHSMFHLSDEPTPECAESYQQARSLVQSIVPDIFLFDTLSDLSLYQKGLIDHPIVSISHAEAFQAAKVSYLWIYYSCVDGSTFSNCFLSMPLSRVRAIGRQAIAFGADGFLHWAFNFWNTQHSISPIDPNIVADAGGAFPSGDAFLVYPGADGPLCSLRLKMLAWAMEDIRAGFGA